jgi:predicted porin
MSYKLNILLLIGDIMKFQKTLLVAALIGGFATTAYSQQSSVTLFGLIDAGAQYNSVSTPSESSSSNLGVASGQSRPTVFGLRGVESLGDGNSVVFNLTSGFNTVNGQMSNNGMLFSQQATLGFKNARFGQVDIGRQTNLASKYFQSIDPFSTFYGQAGMGSSFGTTGNLRYSNMLMYQTPTFNGFSGGLGYSFNTGLASAYADQGIVTDGSSSYGTMNNTRALTLGVNYANGPLQVTATYDQIMPANNIGTGNNSTPKSWILGASYDFQVVKASLAYGQTRSGVMMGTVPTIAQVSNPSASQGGALFQDGYGANSYLVGISAPIKSNQKVFASYQFAQATANAIDLNGDQSIYSAGYEYSFSKRTTAYAYASYANNYLMVDGVKSTSVGVGMRHAF